MVEKRLLTVNDNKENQPAPPAKWGKRHKYEGKVQFFLHLHMYSVGPGLTVYH